MLTIKSFSRNLLTVLIIIALAVSLSACAAATPTPVQSPPPNTVPSPAATIAPAATPGATASVAPSATGPTAIVNLTYQNNTASTSTITVPAGSFINLTLFNADAGVVHNFSVYADSTATKSIFVGYQLTGPAGTTYIFTAPTTPGTYYWRCDFHPVELNGQFIVQ